MRWILAVILLPALAACVVHRLDVTPVDVTVEEPIVVATSVKAHLTDGSTVVFADGINVADGIIRGSGERYDLTLEFAVPVTEIPPRRLANASRSLIRRCLQGNAGSTHRAPPA